MKLLIGYADNKVEKVMGVHTYTDYENNAHAASHLHVHKRHELVICHTPAAIVFSGNNVVRPTGDIAIFYPAGEAHLQLNHPNVEYRRFLVEYPTDFLDDVMPPDQNPQDFYCISLQPCEMRKIQPYIDLLLASRDEAESEWLENRQKYLLALLVNELSGFRSNTAESENAVRNRDRLIYQVCLYIQLHYREKITIDTLSNYHFICRSTLTKKFRAMIGMSINEYIKHVRINYALQFLQQGYSVSETALMCGFSSSCYFIKVFEEISGTTPKKYQSNL